MGYSDTYAVERPVWSNKKSWDQDQTKADQMLEWASRLRGASEGSAETMGAVDDTSGNDGIRQRGVLLAGATALIAAATVALMVPRKR